MKKQLIIKVLLITTLWNTSEVVSYFNNNSKNTISTTITSKYCEGWEDGYCEGWKDVKGIYAVCPITPICPIPGIGQDTYKGGYNAGFKAGSSKAKY
jgi:hypothetical protein